jgi:choline monooxygenase
MAPECCDGLGRHPLSSWHGLQFRGEVEVAHTLNDIAGWPLRDLFSFEGYRLHRISTERYAFDWKIFVEVYLDLYHVRPFHPGLARFVSCDKLTWAFGRNWSCQIAPFGSLTGGTPTFQTWCDEISGRRAAAPAYGALWLTLYPNTTVEVYPETLIVSTIWPDGPGQCLNVVEFYYPESLGPDAERYAAAQQAAYDETAAEDGELGERIQRGKHALARRGIEAVSPDHPHLEAGITHFHEWLRHHFGVHAR